jgi:DNA-binding NarL/FixJ family response regulator
MPDSTILTITSDDEFLSVFRQQLHDQVGGGSRMIVAQTSDEACSLLKTARPRLIVVHWTGDGGRYDQLDRLLWTTTVQARPIPVLVIADRYRTYQATMMYRMGVSEYISRTHHLDQLGPILSAYLPFRPLAAQGVSSSDEVQQGKAWSSNHKPGSVASQAV